MKASKIIKKSLKWLGITFIVLLIAIILIPILFKDQIKQMVIDEVNKSLNAELALGDIDLTLLSTFPNTTVFLYDLSLTGKDDFEGVELLRLDELEATVGLWSIIGGDQIKVNSIHARGLDAEVLVLANGKANYDIVQSDSTQKEEETSSSNFKLALQEYSLDSVNVTYNDMAGGMYAQLVNLQHKGNGDLTSNTVHLKTNSNIDQLTFSFGGIDYLSEVKTALDVDLLMEFQESSSKFTLEENKVQLNNFGCSFDGFYAMHENHADMDIVIDASETNFKDLLSLVPAFYQTGYESMLTQGDLKLDGFVRGKMDDTNLPGWDFNMKLDKGSINYPDLPGKIEPVYLAANSAFKGGENLDAMTVDVDQLKANFGENHLHIGAQLRSLLTDPFFKVSADSKINLATLKNYVPTDSSSSYTGMLTSDVALRGNMSDLEKEDYESFEATGDIIVEDMVFQSDDFKQAIHLLKMDLAFQPKQLNLTAFDAKIGSSDFQATGSFQNYFGYFLREEVLDGQFNLNSKHTNLDELMGLSVSSEEGTEQVEQTSSYQDTTGVQIPSNIDFVLASTIGSAQYNKIPISNIKGTVIIKDGVATMEQLNLKAMGGDIQLKGAFDTRNSASPLLNAGYKLKNIDIQELASNFLTVKQLVPIAKYAQGKISSNLDFSSALTSGWSPVLSSISSLGDIHSDRVTLKDFPILNKVSEVTHLSNMDNQTLKNFTTIFKVKDGKIEVEPFDVTLFGLKTEVSGFSSLDQKMDYRMQLNVPKNRIPKTIIDQVEKSINKLNNTVAGLNISSLPDEIPVDVKILGDMKNPNVTSNFKQSLMKATGDMKDQIINTVKDKVKDTVTAIVTDKVEEVKEDFEAKKKQILDDAQKQADRVKAEAKKAADRIRQEADTQANKLIQEAGNNPIQKKIAEKGAEKIRSTAEKKAAKLETEADQKADQIMAKAQQKADALG